MKSLAIRGQKTAILKICVYFVWIFQSPVSCLHIYDNLTEIWGWKKTWECVRTVSIYSVREMISWQKCLQKIFCQKYTHDYTQWVISFCCLSALNLIIWGCYPDGYVCDSVIKQSDNIRRMTFLSLFCSLPPCRSSDYGSTYTKLNLMPGTTIIVTNFYICPTNKKKVSVFTKSLCSSSLSLK